MAEVTVPIGSSGPAIATLLAAPQSASRARKSIRVAAGRMGIRYPLSAQENAKARGSFRP
jgi:hypothetical protein